MFIYLNVSLLSMHCVSVAWYHHASPFKPVRLYESWHTHPQHTHTDTHGHCLVCIPVSSLIPPLSSFILLGSHFVSFTALLSNGALLWCAMLREMAAEQTGESHFVITRNHLRASSMLISTFFLLLFWSLAWLFLLSLTPRWLPALFQMSDHRPVADKRWRWLQSEAWTNGAGGWWERSSLQLLCL